MSSRPHPKKPEVRPAIINTLVAALVIAAGAVIPRLFWPWEVGNITLAGIGGGILAGFLVFKYLFNDELKKWLRDKMATRAVRYTSATLLCAEAALVIVLLRPPRPRVIRIVPGRKLDLAFPFPGQTLRVELDGKAYEIDSPRSSVVYAGPWEKRVRYFFRAETRRQREDTLSLIVQEKFGMNDAKDFIDRWLKLEPIVMPPKPGRVPAGPAAFMIDPGSKPVTLRLTKFKSSGGGIETYVAELP